MLGSFVFWQFGVVDRLVVWLVVWLVSLLCFVLFCFVLFAASFSSIGGLEKKLCRKVLLSEASFKI